MQNTQRKIACSIDYAMKSYKDGYTILMECSSGAQVFSKQYGDQQFLDFTIADVSVANWFVLID